MALITHNKPTQDRQFHFKKPQRKKDPQKVLEGRLAWLRFRARQGSPDAQLKLETLLAAERAEERRRYLAALARS